VIFLAEIIVYSSAITNVLGPTHIIHSKPFRVHSKLALITLFEALWNMHVASEIEIRATIAKLVVNYILILLSVT